MEHKPYKALFSVPNAVTVDAPHHDAPKKKRGPMYIMKVALFMMRRRSHKSKAFSGSSSKTLWRKLVDSVGPLHLQLQQVEPIKAEPAAPTLTLESPAHTEFSEDALFSPSAGGSTRSATDTPYASAVNLNEMDQGESETEVEAKKDSKSVSKDGDGDEMIDAKAEEFISNFYNEMKLQRRYSINERSLG